MTILSREALGIALRDLLRLDYPSFNEAARIKDIDAADLRRGWCGHTKHNKSSMERLLYYCRTFNYEVHFTVQRKEKAQAQTPQPQEKEIRQVLQDTVSEATRQ